MGGRIHITTRLVEVHVMSHVIAHGPSILVYKTQRPIPRLSCYQEFGRLNRTDPAVLRYTLR
jgi:hypothetical protein